MKAQHFLNSKIEFTKLIIQTDSLIKLGYCDFISKLLEIRITHTDPSELDISLDIIEIKKSDNKNVFDDQWIVLIKLVEEECNEFEFTYSAN